MYTTARNSILAFSFFACNFFYATETATYTVAMGYNDSLKITLNSYQYVPSTSRPGELINFPHLWRLDGLLSQNVLRLSDETKTTDNGSSYRVYDLKEGHKKYSATNLLTSVMLMPVYFLGFATLTPYEQEFLLYTNHSSGTVRLTFICEKRYCWEAPTKIAHVDITVTDTPKIKNHTLYIQ